MLVRVGLRHQDLDVASDQLAGRIAEEPLGRLVDRADRAVAVDDHNGVGGGIDDRTIRESPSPPLCSRCRLADASTQLSDPRHWPRRRRTRRGRVPAEAP